MQVPLSKTGSEELKHPQEVSLEKEVKEGLSPQDNKVLLKDYLRLQFKERRMEAVLRKAGDKVPPSYPHREALKRDLRRLQLMEKLQPLAKRFLERSDNMGFFSYPSSTDAEWLETHTTEKDKIVLSRLYALDPIVKMFQKLDVHQSKTSFYFWTIKSYAERMNSLKQAILTNAAALGQTKLCQQIYERSIKDFHWDKFDKHSALFLAVKRKRLGTAEWLLQHGMTYKEKDIEDNPVLKACFDGNIPALKMFHRNGVDLSTPFAYKKSSHITPLDIALFTNQPQTTKALLEMGANPDLAGYFMDILPMRKFIHSALASQAMGTENIALLQDYFTKHPAPVQKKTFFKRFFSRSGQTR